MSDKNIFLYHYTSIETLSIILNDKKLRFNRVDKVNDFEEVKIDDLPHMKENIFVSCWTESDEESIPLWHLYASRTKGVRLGLPANMFKRGSKSYEIEDGRSRAINIYSLDTTVNRNEFKQWIPFIIGPISVNYSIDNIVNIKKREHIDITKIGTVKLNHWAFEKETRFLIIPDVFWNPQTNGFEVNDDYAKVPVADEFVDIPLDENVLNSIEITMGPGTSEPELIIVDSLICRFTTNGKIRRSRLSKKLKIA